MDLRFIRKALAAVSATAIALSAVIIPSSPVVSAAEWYTPYNNGLFDLGIVDATGNAFRPGDNVNRAELAAMLNRTVGFAVDASEVDDPGFSDVSESDWFYVDVAALENAGVVQGTTPTTYSPGENVNRAAAAKMIVLALDLPTSDDNVPFSDVSDDDWYAPYVASLYSNSIVDGVGGTNKFDGAAPITRAAMAKMLALGIAVSEADPGTYARVNGESAFAMYSAEEIVAFITGGEIPVDDEDDDDEEPVVGDSDSSLTVSLASDTPMAATIPNNGFNVPFTYVNFTAGPEEGVNVTGLTITRTGLGAAGNFANIKLYQGMTQLSSEKTIGSQTNSATFNLNSTPVSVGAGSTKTVRVLGDMLAAGTTVGVSNQLGVASANDVTAVGSETGGTVGVNGSFPVYGNAMTTSGASVGTLTYDVTDPNATGTFYIGDQNRVMTKINLQASTEDMDLVALTFRQEGSAGSDEVANLSLYNNGSLIGGPVQMVDRYVTFELGSPLFIERGSSVNLELRGDIVGGYNKDVGFDIYRDWHVNAVGRVYGYPVRVTDNTPGFAITVDNITGSRLSVSAGQRNPTVSDIKINAKDAVTTQFNIINTGDTVDIRNLPLGLNVTGATITPNMVSDVKIWRLDDDYNFVNVVAGPIDPAVTTPGGSQILVFSDVFEVEANTTAKFAVTCDLSNTAPTGEAFSISLINPDGTSGAPFGTATSGFEVRNVATGDIIYNNSTAGTKKITISVTGNNKTVALPTLDFNVASAPSKDAFVINSTNVPLVAFNVKAGSADDVTLNSLTTTLTLGTTAVKSYGCNGTVAAADLAALKLYADIDGTETLLAGPEDINGTTANFNGFELDIPAGETVRVIVRANLPSSGTSNNCPTVSIAGTGSVSANDSDGRPLTTAGQVTITHGNRTADAGGVLSYAALAASGKLRVSVANDTPNEGQVIAGAEDVPVAKLKFEASSVEDVEIHKLRLYNHNANTDSAVKYVKLYDGETLVASGTLSGQYVVWESLALLIPRNSAKTITVAVDYNSSNDIQTIAGMAPRFVIRNLEDNWLDGSSGAAPDGAIDPAATPTKGGDIKVVGKQSGLLLSNVAGTTDAIAGDRGFYATVPTNENLCDSVGVESTTYTAACAAGGATYPLTGNTLTEAQYVYNTKITASLEGGANGTPVGNQGAAAGNGVEVPLLKFRIAAAANDTAANPREVVLTNLYFTVSGDAEADNFKLYGESSSQVAMGTSTAVHRTNLIGTTGAGTGPTNHATRTTIVPFTALTGNDVKIAYGDSKVYTLKANTYAITDNDSPVRSLRVYIDNYGTSAGGSDIVWLDNGTSAENTNTRAVYWVHEEGVDELKPSSPMTYSTSSSFITATTAAPTLLVARAIAGETVQAIFNLPIDSGTVDTAPSTLFYVDATSATDTANTAPVANNATVIGNVVTLTSTGGTAFGLTQANWSQVAGAPEIDIDADPTAGVPITDDLEAIGSAASGSNISYTPTTDTAILQNF